MGGGPLRYFREENRAWAGLRTAWLPVRWPPGWLGYVIKTCSLIHPVPCDESFDSVQTSLYRKENQFSFFQACSSLRVICISLENIALEGACLRLWERWGPSRRLVVQTQHRADTGPARVQTGWVQTRSPSESCCVNPSGPEILAAPPSTASGSHQLSSQLPRALARDTGQQCPPGRWWVPTQGIWPQCPHWAGMTPRSFLGLTFTKFSAAGFPDRRHRSASQQGVAPSLEVY